MYFNKSQKSFDLIVKFLSLAALIDFVFFPFPLLAEDIKNVSSISESAYHVAYGLPVAASLEATEEDYHTITAYNSEIGQCDSSPCVTANGFNLCKHDTEDSVAANFLPLGTKIKIPELFGDQVFVVRDRMNARYTNRIDVWMRDKTDARSFGVKEAKIEILE